VILRQRLRPGLHLRDVGEPLGPQELRGFGDLTLVGGGQRLTVAPLDDHHLVAGLLAAAREGLVRELARLDRLVLRGQEVLLVRLCVELRCERDGGGRRNQPRDDRPPWMSYDGTPQPSEHGWLPFIELFSVPS